MGSLTRRSVLFGSLLAVSACSSKFVEYDGPEVTRLIVLKERRVMYALSGTKVIERYDVELGFGATIDKRVEGDGGTPVGRYRIDRRNPNRNLPAGTFSSMVSQILAGNGARTGPPVASR